MMGVGASRTVKGKNIRLRHEFVEAIHPVSLKHAFDSLWQSLAVMVGDLQAESAGPVCDRLSDAPHANDAEDFPRQASHLAEQ